MDARPNATATVPAITDPVTGQRRPAGPQDLTFTDHDGALWHFAARSQHNRTRLNTVSYCPADRSAECDCAAGEHGVRCWHVTVVERAWLALTCAAAAAQMSDAELRDAGHAAAILADHPDAMLDALRAEWRTRQQRQAA